MTDATIPQRDAAQRDAAQRDYHRICSGLP